MTSTVTFCVYVFFVRRAKDLKKVPIQKYTPSQEYLAIVRYRIRDLELASQGLQSHFVVLDPVTLDAIYDPMEKGSRHVREGQLIDLRVFV